MGKMAKSKDTMRIGTNFLLGIVIFICTMVLPVSKVSASSNITIAGVDLGYSDGSYFSKTGSACKCHGRGTCGEAADCTCIVISGASQCYGWSMWVENKLFGVNERLNPSDFITVLSGYSNCTGSGLYNKLNGKIGAGTHIRTSSSQKGYAHSVTVISYDSNGINITDCNHSGRCQVDVRYYTWDRFASFMNGYGGISFVKTYKDSGESGNSGVDPIGYLDSYSGGEGVVNISGWARDDDAPNQGIEIHVYIGGPSGSAGADGYPGIYANSYREDVGQHAYSARIKTNKRGRQNIYVYAIQVGGGTNVLIGEGTVMIAESEPPKISNVRIENRSAKGYTIKCDVTDNVGIASVKFPTWTVQNGQDDLKWYEGIVSGNSAECTIDVSNHNNETNCYYKTHIYADDTSGNESFFGIGETFVDSTPPTIYNVRIDNVTDKGFDISCKVSDNEGIARIKCPTWTRKNWQDDLSKDWQ